MFEKIKKFYDMGLYNEQQIFNFYVKGVIDRWEYTKITGKEERL